MSYSPTSTYSDSLLPPFGLRSMLNLRIASALALPRSLRSIESSMSTSTAGLEPPTRPFSPPDNSTNKILSFHKCTRTHRHLSNLALKRRGSSPNRILHCLGSTSRYHIASYGHILDIVIFPSNVVDTGVPLHAQATYRVHPQDLILLTHTGPPALLSTTPNTSHSFASSPYNQHRSSSQDRFFPVSRSGQCDSSRK